MIVADTSALVSLASVDCLDTLLTEYEVHTTRLVLGELEATAGYEDAHGEAARTVLTHADELEVHDIDPEVTTSRIDDGESSTAALANDLGADFLITDDLRALPELEPLVDARVAISPIVLKAFVERGVLDHEAAVTKLEALAETRDWLGAPIYRRARNLFDA